MLDHDRNVVRPVGVEASRTTDEWRDRLRGPSSAYETAACHTRSRV